MDKFNTYQEQLKMVHETCRYYAREHLATIATYTERIPDLMSTYGQVVRTGMESFIEKTCETSQTKLTCKERDISLLKQMDNSGVDNLGNIASIPGFVYYGNFCKSESDLGLFRPAKDKPVQRTHDNSNLTDRKNDWEQTDDHSESNDGRNQYNADVAEIGTDVDCGFSTSSCRRNCDADNNRASSPTCSHSQYNPSPPSNFICKNCREASPSLNSGLHKRRIQARQCTSPRVDSDVEFEEHFTSTTHQRYSSFRRKLFSNDSRCLPKEKEIQTELQMDMFPRCDLGQSQSDSSKENAFHFPYNTDPVPNRRRRDIEIDAINDAFDINESVMDLSDISQDTRSPKIKSVSFINKRDLIYQVTFYGQREVISRSDNRLVFSASYSPRPRRSVHVVVKFSVASSDAQVLEEARILAQLNQTGYIPNFIGITTETLHNSTRLGLVSEYFGSGLTLKEAMGLNFDILHYPEFWVNLCLQLVRGLRMIHEYHVILGDLREENVLVDCNLRRHIDRRIRFTNFSKSTFNKGRPFSNMADTPDNRHVAPEVREGIPTSIQSDIFSLGFIMLQMALCGKFPPIVDIAHACMHPHPARRPGYGEILRCIHCLRLDISVSRDNGG